jgi:hypothetical protein
MLSPTEAVKRAIEEEKKRQHSANTEQLTNWRVTFEAAKLIPVVPQLFASHSITSFNIRHMLAIQQRMAWLDWRGRFRNKLTFERSEDVHSAVQSMYDGLPFHQ